MPNERVSGLVGEYFDRLAAGEDLTPEGFADEHPEAAAELRPYLAGLALVAHARTAAEDTASGPATLPNVDPHAIKGYELLAEIGRGGMGVVYRALQLSTKRVVALKVMLAGPFASDVTRRRFEREVELAARLDHQHIVRILESGTVAGQQYYAMDYVEGVRLDHYLATQRPDKRAMLNVLRSICEAVEYAHEHGVIHRDLKPANVLIDADGQPHIVDFGLAKAIDQAEAEAASATVSMPGQVLGTLYYLSPEQAAGTPEMIDARTDVYSLGIMLYEALTGALPFDRVGRPSEVIQRIIEAPATPPSSLAAEVDGELETIVLKALEKSRDHRYLSARDLGEDLRRYLEGEPILAQRPSSLYILRKKLAKHRLKSAFVAVMVAAALVGTLAGVAQRQRGQYAARSRALADQRLLESGSRGRPIASARANFARYPEIPEVRLVLARADYDSEETRNGAIRFLEQQVSRGASRWPDGLLLAEIYENTGDLERARVLREQAEQQARDTADDLYVRSFATLELAVAREYAEAALRRAPARKLTWSRVLYLRLVLGDFAGAHDCVSRLIQLGESRKELELLRGHTLALQGRYRAAIEQYSERAEDQPWSSMPLRYRAHTYRQLGEYEAAIADYTEALRLDGKTTGNAWDLYQRATPLWILGRIDEAVADLRRAHVLIGYPLYSDARLYVLLRDEGRVAEAETVLRSVQGEIREPWMKRIFECLAGECSPEALMSDAGDNVNRQCEAAYYSGEAHRIAGRDGAARACFERCVATGRVFDTQTLPLSPMNEYELARWRLGMVRAVDEGQ